MVRGKIPRDLQNGSLVRGSPGAGAVSLTLANQCPQPAADAVAQSAGRSPRRRAGPAPPRRGTAACRTAGESRARRVAPRTHGGSHAGPAARGGSPRGRAAGRRARRISRADTSGRRPPDASPLPRCQRSPVAYGGVEGGGEQAPIRSHHPRSQRIFDALPERLEVSRTRKRDRGLST